MFNGVQNHLVTIDPNPANPKKKIDDLSDKIEGIRFTDTFLFTSRELVLSHFKRDRNKYFNRFYNVGVNY